MNKEINDIIEGTVIEIKPYGAIMIFDNDSKGLLHISQITNSYIRNINKYLTIGKTYQVKIIEITSSDFLKVSMSKITPEEKEFYKTIKKKRSPINQEEIDFTSLKSSLQIWIDDKKEDFNNDI